MGRHMKTKITKRKISLKDNATTSSNQFQILSLNFVIVLSVSLFLVVISFIPKLGVKILYLRNVLVRSTVA
jgi:hypothetical protein